MRSCGRIVGTTIWALVGALAGSGLATAFTYGQLFL